MANTIQLKRRVSGLAGAPPALKSGELVGVGLKVLCDQAGRGVLTKLLQCQNTQIAIKQQEPRCIWIGLDDRERFDQPDLPN
jgi:hypothetical protein